MGYIHILFRIARYTPSRGEYPLFEPKFNSQERNNVVLQIKGMAGLEITPVAAEFILIGEIFA